MDIGLDGMYFEDCIINRIKYNYTVDDLLSIYCISQLRPKLHSYIKIPLYSENAQLFLEDLKKKYPIEEYPELWL